jgi:hypothetical protein
MTSIATIGGMLPLALGIETGSATQAPLATVVIGGLVSSTLLALLVVPSLYVLASRNGEPGRCRRVDSASAEAALPPPALTSANAAKAD